MEQLHQRKVSFALDDFGHRLRLPHIGFVVFPFDKIKIDRSFVRMSARPSIATIVHAVVSIGRALGPKVVAEGVETIEHQNLVTLPPASSDAGLPVRRCKSSMWRVGRVEFHDRWVPTAHQLRLGDSDNRAGLQGCTSAAARREWIYRATR